MVACCVRLLGRQDADDALVFTIGGPGARAVLDGGQQYWLRVWAPRALLYSWDEMARAAVLDALADEAWRVREMAAKVVARRLLGEALAASGSPRSARRRSSPRQVPDYARARCILHERMFVA